MRFCHPFSAFGVFGAFFRFSVFWGFCVFASPLLPGQAPVVFAPPRPCSSLLVPSRLFIPFLGSVVAYLLSSLSSGPLHSQLCPGRAFFVPADRIFQIWVEANLGDLLQSTLIHRAPLSPLSTPWMTLHRSTAHLSLRASCRLAYASQAFLVSTEAVPPPRYMTRGWRQGASTAADDADILPQPQSKHCENHGARTK